MKIKFSIILALSLAVYVYSSCTEEVTNELPDDGIFSFSAVVEESLTRANFNDLSGQSCAFKWELGDIVGIYPAGSSEKKEVIATEVANNAATLTGTNIPSSTHYLGVYPSSACVSIGSSSNVVKVNIPNEQVVPLSSAEKKQYVASNAFIQVGYTAGNEFTMMTPCSFLKFNTGNNSNIEWVKIQAFNSSNQPYGIVGDITVTKSATSSIELSQEGSSANEVICKYAGGKFPTDCDFAIAIRPGSYAKIVLTTNTGIEKTATTMKNPDLSTANPSPLSFARAYYYSMGTLEDTTKRFSAKAENSTSADNVNSNNPNTAETPTRANFNDLSGQSCAFKWELGDIVGIYPAGSSEKKEVIATEVANNAATLTGTNIPSSTHYLGVYPSSACVSIGSSSNVVKVNIPNEQVVPLSSAEKKQYVASNAFIQVGYTAGNEFTMMTPCSFLKFNTGNNSNIEWVKIQAFNSSNQPYGIVGDITVTKSATSSIELSQEGSSANEVICKYAGGKFPTDCDFAIAIRPGSYAKIVLTTNTGIEKTATTMKNPDLSTANPSPLSFARAYYYSMGTLE